MSSGYDGLDAGAWFDDLEEAETAGFYRGRVAAESRPCCPHQPDCPMMRPSFWRRLLGGGRR